MTGAVMKAKLAALAVARNGFTDTVGLADDLALTEMDIALLKHFSSTILQFGGPAHLHPQTVAERNPPKTREGS